VESDQPLGAVCFYSVCLCFCLIAGSDGRGAVERPEVDAFERTLDRLIFIHKQGLSSFISIDRSDRPSFVRFGCRHFIHATRARVFVRNGTPPTHTHTQHKIRLQSFSAALFVQRIHSSFLSRVNQSRALKSIENSSSGEENVPLKSVEIPFSLVAFSTGQTCNGV
jgi:hypothetical protein